MTLTISAISPANCGARLYVESDQRNRDCYVLELEPKRHGKLLIDETIRVDKQDFAIEELEGESSRTSSV